VHILDVRVHFPEEGIGPEDVREELGVVAGRPAVGDYGEVGRVGGGDVLLVVVRALVGCGEGVG